MSDNGISRAIRTEEIPACLEMLDRAFDGTPNGYFLRYFEGNPWHTNEHCRVYVRDGRIVSGLNIVKREVRVGSAKLVMGGIANVGTEPDERGKGYSSEVLRDSVKTMDGEEMDFSILYTGLRLFPFYARFGWRELPTPRLVGSLKTGGPTDGAGSYTMRPYRDDDAAALLGIYDQFNAERAFTSVRNESFWRNFVLHKFHHEWRIEFAEYEGKPVAYLMSGVHGKNLAIDELGFIPGHEVAFNILLRRAAGQAAAEGAERLTIEPAGDAAVVAAACEIAEGLETEPWRCPMVLFFNLNRTFSRLLPELNNRARAAELTGSVAIETEVGSVALVADGSQVGMVDESEVTDTAKLTQADLARLVFGIAPVSAPESEMPDRAKDFLNTLFPLQPCVYWEADKF